MIPAQNLLTGCVVVLKVQTSSKNMKILFIILFAIIGIVEGFPDWLVTKVNFKSSLRVINNGQVLELTNGLISRKFSQTPGFATIDFYSHEKKSSLLRAIQPEAIIRIEDKLYNIGGFAANITRAYLNRSALHEAAKPDSKSFQYSSHELTNITAQ
jgi:hypothetical protein